MAEGSEEEEEEDEESASMVCDERGRNAMSRRQGLWRIEHGNVVLFEVVQSRADSGRVRVSVRAGDEAMRVSVPTVWIGSVERDCRR